MLHAPTSAKKSTTVRSKRAMRFARAALQAAYVLSEDLGTSVAERMFTTPRRFHRPARELPILARGHRFTIDVTLGSPRWGGLRTPVTAWRWGVGPTVLLVHGWEGRGAQLGAFVEPLVAAGLSVVTFDAPAHGASPGSRAYLTDIADTIVDVAVAVGPLHGIVAHSFGCAAVLLAQSRGDVTAPHNVFIAPNILIPESVGRFTHALGLDSEERQLFEKQIVASSGMPLEGLLLPALVGKRDASLLVIHDTEDREVPHNQGEKLVASWPAPARLESTSHLGHRRILRDPGVVALAVAEVRRGVPQPTSDLVREVDRQLAAIDAESAPI